MTKFKRNKNFAEILEFEETTRFIQGLDGNSRSYLSVLQKYVDFTEKTPAELIEEAKKDIRKAKEETLFAFRDYLLKEGVSPTSVRQYIGSKLSRFYKRNDVPVNWFKEDWDTMPDDKVKSKSIKIDGDKTKNWKIVLKKMLKRMKIHRDKAILSCMFSSGMDSVDLFKVTKRQYDEGYDKDTNTALIEYRRQKTKVKAVTFLSSEACDFLKEYFDSERKPFTSDTETLFLTYDNASKMTTGRYGARLRKLTDELGINGVTPKTLRRLCETYLIDSGLNFDFRQLWLGRTTGVSQFYNLFTHHPEKFRERCLEVAQYVTIGNGHVYNGKIEDLEKKVQKMEKLVEILADKLDIDISDLI